MRISILTMTPEFFGDFLRTPVISRSVQADRLAIEVIDFRDYVQGSFRKVDDSPYGGGRGMIIRCEPVINALEAIRTEESRTILLCPGGAKYNQKQARILSGEKHLILICGHYEGFDARIYDYVDETLSIGDYILTGGELAAMVVADSVVRLLKGSLREGSADEESFESGLLEYPQYTRPAEFRGKAVPDVLISGNHEAIRKWREEQALARTKRERPDLLGETNKDKESL